MKTVTMILVCAMIFSCATNGESRKQAAIKNDNQTAAVSLNNAVGEFSVYIAGRLPGDTLTAVAVTDAPIQRLGNYVADELAGSLLNNSGLRMVSRQDFERVLTEQNLQTALNFNDDTTAKVGHNLGWRTIIYGTVEPLQEGYSLSLRAVDVETGELRGSKSYILNGSDPILINLVNPNISVQRLTERETLLQPL
jgi:hypothetical protein